MAKKNWIEKLIYKITKKPKHYKAVKKPPKTAIGKLLRPKAARQMQYNEWSKKHKVYSGSYLPRDGSKLEKKGWINETNNIVKNDKRSNTPRFFRRKSTNQWVRDDKTHWHWYNWWKKILDHKKIKENKNQAYYDKYGEKCARGSQESHIQGEE